MLLDVRFHGRPAIQVFFDFRDRASALPAGIWARQSVVWQMVVCEILAFKEMSRFAGISEIHVFGVTGLSYVP